LARYSLFLIICASNYAFALALRDSREVVRDFKVVSFLAEKEKVEIEGVCIV